jgi:hypothetical protein
VLVPKRENEYQKGLRKRIEARFPNCIVLKNDEQLLGGIFDLTVLYGPFYAALEVKRGPQARYEPNQEYYLARVSDMGGISATIHPENEEEVLDALQFAFESRG